MKGVIVVFRLPPKTDHKVLNKFCQRVYGQNSSSWNGKYHFHRHGLLEEIPHRRLIRGVIILRSKDLNVVKEFLGQYSAEVYIRTINLTDEDKRFLKSSS